MRLFVFHIINLIFYGSVVGQNACFIHRDNEKLTKGEIHLCLMENKYMANGVIGMVLFEDYGVFHQEGDSIRFVSKMNSFGLIVLRISDRDHIEIGIRDEEGLDITSFFYVKENWSKDSSVIKLDYRTDYSWVFDASFLGEFTMKDDQLVKGLYLIVIPTSFWRKGTSNIEGLFFRESDLLRNDEFEFRSLCEY